MEDDFLVLNIREYIKMGKAGEDMLRQVFSSFKYGLTPKLQKNIKKTHILGSVIKGDMI